jgi:hypothetical protein
MSAFSYSTKNQIESNIRAMFFRVKQISRLSLSHEDFSALFVPAEHREMYREMSMLARTGEGQSAAFTWGDTKLRFALVRHNGQNPIPIPRGMTLQHDAPTELVEQITVWANTVGNASREYGRVQALFTMLNETMTRGQTRFVWPSILALLAVNPILSENLKLLQELKVPAKCPDLPPGLLQACRKTASTISTATLIPADVPDFEILSGFVEVVDGQDYEELGLGAFRGAA